MTSLATGYEVVIGLEVHAQIRTKTKMFCGCLNIFGDPPNTHACPVCLGMPGSLPVPNEEALEKALMVGMALHCELAKDVRFDRKNYYYPDLPKNYQISQDRLPLGSNGKMELTTGKTIRINNIHLEEDAGKLVHVAGTNTSIVDLNRAGVPLLEIVTEPDFRDLDEVSEYMTNLRDILLFTGACDCEMQQGSLRFEVSLSLRPEGTEAFGNRVEVKNLNSFRHVLNVSKHEIERQAKVLDEGGTVDMETRLWDVDKEESAPMRSKESAKDYRYFPEPDIVPKPLTSQQIVYVRQRLPELPRAMRKRFNADYKLSDMHIDALTDTPEMATFFEELIRLGREPQEAAAFTSNEIRESMREKQLRIPDGLGISPQGVADLLGLVSDGVLSSSLARKDVWPRMVETGDSASAIVDREGLAQMGDDTELREFCRQAIEAVPKAVADVRAGKMKAISALLGQVMRLTKGKAPPERVREILLEEIGAE